jgi:hypothetical protein
MASAGLVQIPSRIPSGSHHSPRIMSVLQFPSLPTVGHQCAVPAFTFRPISAANGTAPPAAANAWSPRPKPRSSAAARIRPGSCSSSRRSGSFVRNLVPCPTSTRKTSCRRTRSIPTPWPATRRSSRCPRLVRRGLPGLRGRRENSRVIDPVKANSARRATKDDRRIVSEARVGRAPAPGSPIQVRLLDSSRRPQIPSSNPEPRAHQPQAAAIRPGKRNAAATATAIEAKQHRANPIPRRRTRQRRRIPRLNSQSKGRNRTTLARGCSSSSSFSL